MTDIVNNDLAISGLAYIRDVFSTGAEGFKGTVGFNPSDSNILKDSGLSRVGDVFSTHAPGFKGTFGFKSIFGFNNVAEIKDVAAIGINEINEAITNIPAKLSSTDILNTLDKPSSIIIADSFNILHYIPGINYSIEVPTFPINTDLFVGLLYTSRTPSIVNISQMAIETAYKLDISLSIIYEEIKMVMNNEAINGDLNKYLNYMDKIKLVFTSLTNSTIIPISMPVININKLAVNDLHSYVIMARD